MYWISTLFTERQKRQKSQIRQRPTDQPQHLNKQTNSNQQHTFALRTHRLFDDMVRKWLGVLAISFLDTNAFLTPNNQPGTKHCWINNSVSSGAQWLASGIVKRSINLPVPGTGTSTTMSQSTNHNTEANSEQECTVTWETQISATIQERLTQQNNAAAIDRPFLVAVAGIPGSGKSTSSQILSETLDTLGITNIVMPMDGYHYPLSTLQTMDNENNSNSQDFVYRRGAPDTFDSSSLKQDLERIVACKDKVYIPGFDHAKGDPEPNKYTYEPLKHRVVICEGLYLLHSDDGWKDIGDLFDLSVFIRADVDVCVDRLKVRNLCIPGYTKEEIIIRCDAVDRVNAMTVLASSARADFIVDSIAL